MTGGALLEDCGLLYRRLVDAEEKNEGCPDGEEVGFEAQRPGASTNEIRLLKSVHMHLEKRAVCSVQLTADSSRED